MEHPPSPTDSDPSRRGSHVLGVMLQSLAAGPQEVCVRRESRFSMDNNTSFQQQASRPSSTGVGRIPEQSPLLTPLKSGNLSELPVDEDFPVHSESVAGPSSIAEHAIDGAVSRSSWYLFLLALSIGGLQLAWATELSYGSPYLLSLGLSKSLLALVWIAGPLSGTLVQPYVGIKSDRCQSRFGRRRPFMVGGAIATIASLLALAWAQEIVGGIFAHIFRVPRGSQATKTTTIVFAVIMIYVLDFSVNVVQAGVRAFIVDNTPTHQQDAANAWASRLSNLGNIVGYLFGYADLPKVFWFFGETQFKDLCVISSLGLLTTIAISCFSISERDPRRDGDPGRQTGGIIAFFRELARSVRRLPRQIKRVCQVQLAAWIGWFPFLFYATSYIGEIYVDPIFRENPHLSAEEVDAVWDRGTRIGTFALMIFAISSLASSFVIPWFTMDLHKPPQPIPPAATTPLTPITATTLMTTPSEGGNEYFSQTLAKSSSGSWAHPLPSAYRKIRERILHHTSVNVAIPGMTLRGVWLASHIVFALLMWLTFAARSTTSATILVALVGIPWAVTLWAPFALIAAEVSKRERMEGIRSLTGDHEQQGEETKVTEVGLILGIHNVAIAAPQVVATLVSSAIFKALQKPRGVAGDGSVAWVLRFGGVCALLAAALTLRVAEEGEVEEERAEDT